jgi:hypothetical protein
MICLRLATRWLIYRVIDGPGHRKSTRSENFIFAPSRLVAGCLPRTSAAARGRLWQPRSLRTGERAGEEAEEGGMALHRKHI